MSAIKLNWCICEETEVHLLFFRVIQSQSLTVGLGPVVFRRWPLHRSSRHRSRQDQTGESVTALYFLKETEVHQLCVWFRVHWVHDCDDSTEFSLVKVVCTVRPWSPVFCRPWNVLLIEYMLVIYPHRHMEKCCFCFTLEFKICQGQSYSDDIGSTSYWNRFAFITLF